MRRNRFFAALRMTGRSLRMTVGALAVAVMASCSVKEDRSDCPCWLTVDLSETNGAYVQLKAWCPAPVFSESIPRSQRDDFHEYRVPRGQVRLSAYRETPGLFLEGDVLSITEGSQMDSLFASTTLVNTVAEFAHETIRLHKNFATVSVIFKDEENGRPADCRLDVSGTVAGINVQTLAPVPGRFSCTAEEPLEGGFTFRVPRQMDANLNAALYSRDGILMESYPVGWLIQQAGFDWNKTDLSDVEIMVDTPTATFTITVKEWDGPVSFSVTI